jgi:hypothetical protein
MLQVVINVILSKEQNKVSTQDLDSPANSGLSTHVLVPNILMHAMPLSTTPTPFHQEYIRLLTVQLGKQLLPDKLEFLMKSSDSL